MSQTSLHRFAQPTRIRAAANRLLPFSAGLGAFLLAAGLIQALFIAPPDYQQGEAARIMFVHVPAAWMAMMIYAFMAAASAGALIWRHAMGDVVAKSLAPVGAAFTLICLATGSLWGRPMWGTWWVWDARLTSVLILFFLYLGHMALSHAFDDPQRGQRAAAILAIVGAINLPIIQFSVDWWNTLHQPASLLRAGGSAIDSAMLWPLFTMALAFLAIALTVAILRLRIELAERRVCALTLAAAA